MVRRFFQMSKNSLLSFCLITVDTCFSSFFDGLSLLFSTSVRTSIPSPLLTLLLMKAESSTLSSEAWTGKQSRLAEMSHYVTGTVRKRTMPMPH